jgi:hypothetical protein
VLGTELFDPATQSFSAAGGTASSHWAGSLTPLADGRWLLAGGVTSGGGDALTLNTAEIYSPATGAWTPAASMLQARQQHSATLLADGRVIAIGGFDFALNGQVATSEYFTLTPPPPIP